MLRRRDSGLARCLDGRCDPAGRAGLAPDAQGRIMITRYHESGSCTCTCTGVTSRLDARYAFTVMANGHLYAASVGALAR